MIKKLIIMHLICFLPFSTIAEVEQASNPCHRQIQNPNDNLGIDQIVSCVNNFERENMMGPQEMEAMRIVAYLGLALPAINMIVFYALMKAAQSCMNNSFIFISLSSMASMSIRFENYIRDFKEEDEILNEMEEEVKTIHFWNFLKEEIIFTLNAQSDQIIDWDDHQIFAIIHNELEEITVETKTYKTGYKQAKDLLQDNFKLETKSGIPTYESDSFFKEFLQKDANPDDLLHKTVLEQSQYFDWMEKISHIQVEFTKREQIANIFDVSISIVNFMITLTDLTLCKGV